MKKSGISLSELNNSIKDVISGNFMDNIWIIAEIGDIKFNRNGHAYLELIEKSENTDTIIAKTSANIWSYTLRMLKPYFETTTGQSLQSGLKILVSVKVEFHEIYGFSLNIRDIDPTYTLGDIEKRRLEIIEQLKSEGVFKMNKELELPDVVQKIAIISSETAAGYEDFMQQLKHNSYGYRFYTKLFPATMQGEQTESTVIEALNKIFEYEDVFDAVIIIRGGGARSDLMSFDSYDLAYFITQFPLPVIVGVGHEKDQSIIDLVSHSSLKTPTAVAEFLIANMYEFEQSINNLFTDIYSHYSNQINDKNQRLDTFNLRLVPLVKDRLNIADKKLQFMSQKINFTSKSLIDKNKEDLNYKLYDLSAKSKAVIKTKDLEIKEHINSFEYMLSQQLQKQTKKLEFLEKSIDHLNPINILKKGYSISKVNGKIISKSSEIEKNHLMETTFYEGSVTSKIIDNK